MKCCGNCHKYFRPKYENSKLCFDCWKKRNDAFNRYDYLVQENQRLMRILSEERLRKTLPAETVRKLLMLAHPDKHDNSKLSNEVTRWLLSQM